MLKKFRKVNAMDKKDRVVQNFISETSLASERYRESQLNLDKSSYFEWSKQSLDACCRYIGTLEGLIEVLKIEYKYKGGDI